MASDNAVLENSQQPILVTGAHRTGTTWVGKMIAAHPGVSYISEPLNVRHRPGVLRATTEHWYTYICEQNEGDYLHPLRDTIQFEYHTLSEFKSLRSLKDAARMGRDWSIFTMGRLFKKRALLKDPFAVFSVPWFANRLSCQVVITIRHPAAFTSSLKRLDWGFDFSHLLSQPLLMSDWLEPYRGEMEEIVNAPKDIISQASLLWCLVYRVVSEYCTQFPSFIIARHEDLSLEPVGGFQGIYDRLGLSFDSRARRAILRSSSPYNPKERPETAIYGTRLDSRANLDTWKERLSNEEIYRIRQRTEEVSVNFYPDQDWA